MTTTEFISLVVRRSNGGVNRQEALQLADIAQKELLNIDTFFMQILPTPTLTTNAGQLTYTLPDGIRNVPRAYTLIPNAYQALYGFSDPGVPYTEYFVPVNIPLTSDPSIPLTATFDFDPGNSVIYYDAFRWCPTLNVESDPLTIPEPYASTTLLSRVMMMIEEQNFGNSVYWRDRFENQDYPRWLAYSSQGSKRQSGQVKNANVYG